MRRVLLGCLIVLATAIAITLVTSLAICLGGSPMLFESMDGPTPLLGIIAGSYFAARGGSWKTGASVGIAFVALWLGFWMYVMGRWNPLLWIEEGLPRLNGSHLFWWSEAIVIGLAGGLMRKVSLLIFAMILIGLWLGAMIFAGLSLSAADNRPEAQNGPPSEEVSGPEPDGTMEYVHSFDFRKGSRLNASVYDCDSDDAAPFDNASTSYTGQDLAALVEKLNFQKAPARRQILCLINGGFFGARGWSVAQHEEPMVMDGRALYQVDALRPNDQAWFFAVNSPSAVLAGRPRFSMLPSIPWDHLTEYQTVLGGVRPLRDEGRSLDLKPGAGVTPLRCSRTSIGWTADGSTLFVLTVFDPDGELASQLQRKRGGVQTGGWDVAQVQKFWEDRQVPFALLFDGGESTQAAFCEPDGNYAFVPSGYEYSFTLGYFHQRPLRFTLPILPPSEAHRGVLDYLYVDGPAGGNR